jgi:hypothetical protein
MVCYNPEAFFTEAFFAYLKQAGKKAKKTPLQAAQDSLLYALEKDYEPELQRLFNEETIQTVLTDDFEKICELFLPIWNAVQVE